MKSLFDIGNEGRALEAILEESGGEIDESLDRWFSEVQEDREAKLESYVYLIAEFEARAEARRNKATALEQHAKADENNAKRLKARLLKAFEVFGWTKVKAGSVTISKAKNGGSTPIVWNLPDDLNELPADFVEYEPRVDKAAVIAALDSDVELPFAKYGERGMRIVIR